MTHMLITGSAGFIGQNLLCALSRSPDAEVVGVDINSPQALLEHALDACDVVFHLAGVNRPVNEDDLLKGNVEALRLILQGLERRRRHPLVVLSSSTQAVLDNPYGRSKRRGEDLLLEFGYRTDTPIRIYRLPGVFGKWCRPNYNSVVATFCHNIARSIPIEVSDPLQEIDLVYVDDVISAFVGSMDKADEGIPFAEIRPVFRLKLETLANKLREFHESRISLNQGDLSDPFFRRLFSTYLSYLPPDGFAYSLEPKADPRGVLAEIVKANGFGQFFVSRTKPGVVRGNHYHDTKVERFLVLDGDARICFRNLSTGEKAEYAVAGQDLRVVDIPPGWTHSIENVGRTDMIVLFWSSEIFDPEWPDTYPAEV